MTEITSSTNPILSTPAQEVGEINDETRKTIQTMWKVHAEKNALGLAAPQIGISLKIAVVGYEPTEAHLKKDPDLKSIPKFVLINPKVVWHPEKAKVQKEACLSVPDEEVGVPRYEKIHIEYQDEAGKKCRLKARGLTARIIQHEIDHLEGKTILSYK